MKECSELKTLFTETLEYIKGNFATDKTVFTAQFVDWLFQRWQTKIVHSRITQVAASQYILHAHKTGKMTKGATTTRDELYQVAKQSKGKHLK